MEVTMTDRLTDALRRAAAAHGVHEAELGKPDLDWPPWYAEHMMRTLQDEGYRICGPDSR
jgi:hypothetical protein